MTLLAVGLCLASALAYYELLRTPCAGEGYRRKYDAQRTLVAFSARLRDETDLERRGRVDCEKRR